MAGRIAGAARIASAALCGWTAHAAAATHDVTVQNFSFSPNDLSIQVGDTVRWTNVEGFHDVTEDTFAWASATGSGWVFERTFDGQDVVLYHCTVHSGPGQSIDTSMNGRITVNAVGAPLIFANGFE